MKELSIELQEQQVELRIMREALGLNRKEFAYSESRIALKGPVSKEKANASQGILELTRIASKESYASNDKEKHKKDAKFA